MTEQEWDAREREWNKFDQSFRSRHEKLAGDYQEKTQALQLKHASGGIDVDSYSRIMAADSIAFKQSLDALQAEYDRELKAYERDRDQFLKAFDRRIKDQEKQRQAEAREKERLKREERKRKEEQRRQEREALAEKERKEIEREFDRRQRAAFEKAEEEKRRQEQQRAQAEARERELQERRGCNLFARLLGRKPDAAPPAPGPDRGRELLAELRKWRKEVESKTLQGYIDELIKLMQVVLDKPNVNHESFFARYDQTLGKLLRRYDEIENARLGDAQMHQVMERIEAGVGQIVVACRNDVAGLFKADMLDIDAETNVFLNELKNKGLLD